jgi:hypothetical protein
MIGAPDLGNGRYVFVYGRSWGPWHTASSASAGHSDCGLSFPEGVTAAQIAADPDDVGLKGICKKCAAHWPEIIAAQAADGSK